MPASSKKTRSDVETGGAASMRDARAASKPRALTKPTRDRARKPEDFKTSVLNIRVKADLKEQATATVDRLGISLPEAVRVFLARIVSEQAIPFVLEVPNAETAAALRQSREVEPQMFAAAQELFDALEKGSTR